MISRYAVVCPGCDVPFVVRLGVSPTKMTRFYLPCPTCRLPIRGRSLGQELSTHQVEFEAQWFKGEGEPSLVVTIDPNVPSRYEATQMEGLGTAPTMTLLMLAGDERAEELFWYLSRGGQAVDQLWPEVRRIFEYYLAGDWDRFNAAGRAMFDEWVERTTTHERATAAFQALGSVLRLIVDDAHPASARFLDRWLKKHCAALASDDYVEFVCQEAGLEGFVVLQRRLFDNIDLFIRRFESWQMGVLRRVVPEENLPLLDGLRLFRDEFDVIRDLYQQGFETVCQVLRYLVAAQNTVKRGNPNDFGPDVPPTLKRKTNPGGVRAFDKLSNHDKLQYVAQVPGWNNWILLLNNRTRNAIGHGSVAHDLRSGLVISDAEPAGVSYLNVVTDVYGVFDTLSASLQVLRSIRVASSPDFEAQGQARRRTILGALGRHLSERS